MHLINNSNNLFAEIVFHFTKNKSENSDGYKLQRRKFDNVM